MSLTQSRLQRVFFVLAGTLIISLFTNWAQSANVIQTSVKEVGTKKQLDDILVTQGFSRNQANQVLKNKIIPTRWHVNPQDKFLVLNDPAKGRTEVRFYLEYNDDAYIFWRTQSDCGVEKREIPFKTVIKAAEGPITGSIDESIKRHFNDEWVVTRFGDAFIWDLNINKRISKEDRFKIIVEEKYDEDQFVKYGQVLQAELIIKGQIFKRVFLAKDGEKVFIDPEKPFKERLFYAPVDFLHISSPFAKRRFHPVRRNFQPHLGMDFALPEGSPVYAPRDGVVTEISHKHGNGNFVVVDHGDGYFSIFNHLQSFAKNLIVGLKVKAGDVIAQVGCTGYCTSPHLHFSIRQGKKMIDPARLTRPYSFKLKDYETSAEYRNVLAGLENSRIPADDSDSR